MSRYATIDQALLEKTKMDKVLPRLVKRGDDEGRKFAQKVLDNAAEVSKQKTAGVKALKLDQPNGTAAKIQKGRSESSDSKDVEKEQAAVRKPSTVANKLSSSGAMAKPSAMTARQPAAKADAKATAKTAAADASVAKIKANNITAKPSGFFSSLKSASKKPGTSSKEDGKSR